MTVGERETMTVVVGVLPAEGEDEVAII